MTLPFEARNEVPCIIVGFADRPVNNVFALIASYFLPAKATQNTFRKFEELVFFDLWIPESRFRFPIPDSGFRFPGFRVALYLPRSLIAL